MFDRLKRIIANRSSTETPSRTLPKGVRVHMMELGEPGEGRMLKIVPIGPAESHHQGGYTVNRIHVEQMLANFEASSTDLLFDIDHDSIWGSTRAAGWSSTVEIRDDGLYTPFPQLTPYGEPFVTNREYRYLSVAFELDAYDHAGNPIGAKLHSVAFTNTPYFDAGQVDPIGNSNTPTDTPEQPADFMDRKTLINRLGLSEDATDAQVDAALDAAKAAQPEPDTDAKIEALTNSVSQLTEAVTTLVANQAAPVIEKPGDEPAGSDADGGGQESGEGKDGAEDAFTPKVVALVANAIETGRITRSRESFFRNSAASDFDGTKAYLDSLKPNSALPGGNLKTRPSKGSTKSSDAFVNSVHPGMLDYVTGQA